MGPGTLTSDRLARTIGFTRLAERTWQECDEHSQLALQSFVQGINAYLQRSSKSLPPEFSITSFNPEPWSPLDPLAILHFFSFNMAGVWNFDLFATSLVNKSSPAATKQLYSQLDRFSGFSIPLQNIRSPWQEFSLSGMARIKNSEPLVMEYQLFSYPHLPNSFYWVHLKSDSIETFISHIPGTPFAWSGIENEFAWSMIPAWSDRVDFYAETIDPNDTTRYITEGISKQLEYQEEVIPVRGTMGQRLLIRKTHHGPLIDRTGIYASSDKRPLSLAWAGRLEGREIDALYHLLTQQNHRKTAVFDSLIHLSTYIIFTDNNGNYGYHQAAGFPRRRPQTGLFVMDGSDARNDWKDLEYQTNPEKSNPEQSIILLTSMTNQFNEYPFQIIRKDMAMDYWKENPDLSFKDFKPLAFQIKKILPHFLPSLQKSIDDSASVYALVNLLNQLDHQSLDPKIAATFFKLYYDVFYANLFTDQIDDLYPLLEHWPVCACTHLAKAFSNQLNYWVDDVNTLEHESVDELVVRAFYHTLDSIRVMSPDMGAWSEDKKVSMQPLLPLKRPVAILYGLGSEKSPARIPIQTVRVGLDSSRSLVIQAVGGQSGHPYSEFYHVENREFSLPGSIVNHTLLLLAK
jgi:penicillin G amidase